MPDCTPSARLNAVTVEKNIPVSVTIELTRRCPLSCRHCYLPETLGRARPGRELSAAGWGKILDKLARAGGLYLVFTGGEPLLRPDLADLCRRARALNFDVRIFSTGLGLTRGLARELSAAGVSGFEISFYGGPSVHDGVTGLRGSFSRSLAAARLLAGAGVKVKMKVPLMTANAGHAGWLKELAKKEGFGLSFDPVIAPANDGGRAALPLRLSSAALGKAVKLIAGPAPAAAPLPPGPGDFICGAGRNVCAVDPAGNLYPCLQLPVRLGNLTRRSFSGLWKSAPWLKRWRSLTVADLAGCAGCADAAWCSRCPGISLLEEGNVLAPNAPACALAGAQHAVYSKSKA
ncbi:MAG: radical SAM protein [Elusimicrobiales bacterium]|nr:radical SAM protein [Elusimicrobiales bacterium]